MKTSSDGFSRKSDWNSGLPSPSDRLAARMIVPPCFDDRQAAGQPLDRLVERRVQRISGRAGDDDVHRPRDFRPANVLHEANAFEERLFHVAGHDRGDAPVAVERDIDDEVAARHAGDLGVLFVDGVAIQDAAVGLGVFEQLGAVPALDRFEGGHAGADQLPAARVAGHQVGLDQAGGDLQVGLHVAAVDPAGNPARSRADERVLLEPGAEMVLDSIARHDLWPEHLELLGVGAGPVQAGRDQDQGALSRNAGFAQTPGASAAGSSGWARAA